MVFLIWKFSVLLSILLILVCQLWTTASSRGMALFNAHVLALISSLRYLSGRILKSSFNLKSLDLRGSTSISCSSIASVVATDLQHLYLSKSSVAKSADIGLVMRKVRCHTMKLQLVPSMCLSFIFWGAYDLSALTVASQSP